MSTVIRPVLLGLALVVLAGCSSMEADPPASEAASLPLLAPGFTLGTTFYGSADPPPTGTPERALLDSMITRGLGGFTYYVDWPDLEPSPSRYTLAAFEATLGALRTLGVQPMVNLTVGDIDAYNLPPALSDGAGGLAEGVALDDPAVLDRFGRLLDRIVPILLAHDVFFLGVGNEVDDRLDGDFASERDAYVRFVEAARERVHTEAPRLTVGVTLTGTAVRARSSTFRALRRVSDAIAFNHAPIQPDFFVRDREAVQPDFREILQAYGDGPILIQELTCPSAASMDASAAWQRECFEQLFEVIRTTPRVRFASIFTFQDLDPSTCTAVRDVIFGDELDDLPDDPAQRLSDYLCELGVIAPDGTPKPAYDAVLEAAAALPAP